MITDDDVKLFKTASENAKTVFLTAHVSPDGDTLGSMLALFHTFRAYFPNIQRIDAVISGKMPDIYKFLPAVDEVKDADKAVDLLDEYDLAFCVDCGSADRLGAAGPYFLNARQSVNIDHHISNSRFGKINIIDVNAAASGEVVADLLTENSIGITREAAICLYAAVLTDTGGFRYSNTSEKVFDLAALLTRQGANPENIYRHIYEKSPKAQAMLQAEALLQARFNSDETLCWAVVSRAMMEKFAAKEEHIEGLVETLRRIDTVLVSAVLRETRDGITKVSLRSDVPYINVADVVTRWNGGGHKMAAGCIIEQPPQEAEKEIIPILEETIRAAKPLSALR